MKIIHEEILFGADLIKKEKQLEICLDDLRSAVAGVVWPVGSKRFQIRPVKDGNGVLPIKLGFVRRLKQLGWKLEERPVLAQGLGPGKIDALKTLGDGRQFAAEWETGNISSSHRALNKMCLGIMEGHLAGGMLILPDRQLYNYLTQRIGNYRELSPYFPVYQRLAIPKGVLVVMAVSYDETSEKIALIPKGLDGNSLRRKAGIQK
ncbi:MAG: hypothetical protein WC661_04675 [Opitutaceae bacterium]|jgi:hypothetical protein